MKALTIESAVVRTWTALVLAIAMGAAGGWNMHLLRSKEADWTWSVIKVEQASRERVITVQIDVNRRLLIEALRPSCECVRLSHVSRVLPVSLAHGEPLRIVAILDLDALSERVEPGLMVTWRAPTTAPSSALSFRRLQ